MRRVYYHENKDIDVSHLSVEEKILLDIYREIAVICGQIFDKQFDPNLMARKFYPADATRIELIEEGQKNNKLLFPHTIVKRKKNGELYEVKYSEVFKDEIAQIVKLLEEAAEVCSSKEYSKYLLQVGKDMQSNDYVESERLWLQLDDEKYDLDIRLGPIVHYADRMMARKGAFLASIRVKNNDENYEFLDQYAKTFAFTHPLSPFSDANEGFDVKFRRDNVVISAGWNAYHNPGITNFPKYQNWGKPLEIAKIILYINNLESNTRFNVSNTSKKIFAKNTLDQLTTEHFYLCKAKYFMLASIIEAASRQRIPYSAKRLKFSASLVRDTQSKVSAVARAHTQLLKGLDDVQSYKNLVATFILMIFSQRQWEQKNTNEIGPHFLLGYRMIMGYLITHGGIKFDEDKKIDIDFKKIHEVLAVLRDELYEILKEGELADARRLVKTYANDEVLKDFNATYDFTID